jgi:hydrogenase/urease accessory protein HupE
MRPMRLGRTLVLAAMAALCVCGLGVGQAVAHPAPFSYLDIVFRNGGIDGTLVVHTIDAAHELKIPAPDTLLDPGVLANQRDTLTAVLTPRLMLRGGSQRLTPKWTSVEPMRAELALRLRFRIDNAQPGALAIDTDLFPYDPQHQTFINIYENDALRQQLIFRSDASEYVYFAGTTQGALEVMKVFIPSGIHHILIGPDHILFLIGLLLTGGRWKTLLSIVTAFTIGHSLTLSLAALNKVNPPPAIIEPAIALSIVFVGADNLVRGEGRDLRAWVAAVFGLVHGFGFANVLREFGLPSQALGWSLFSFNVGVEIGQLSVVLVVAGLLVVIRRQSERLGARVAFAGSLVVIAAGTYWFVQRVFFPGQA